MLKTIDLYVTDECFVANKSMVCVVERYGLCIQNDVFSYLKHMNCAVFRKTSRFLG